MRVIDPLKADEEAEAALNQLQMSALAIPHPELDWSLLDNWSDRKLALQHI